MRKGENPTKVLEALKEKIKAEQDRIKAAEDRIKTEQDRIKAAENKLKRAIDVLRAVLEIPGVSENPKVQNMLRDAPEFLRKELNVTVPNRTFLDLGT